jgi:molecular chaperone DnaK (HSP70)
MGIWNRWKRNGSPHSPGTAALLGSRGMETLPHSVGIETKGGTFTPLIRKGMPLPVRVTEIFTTAEPDQSSVKIKCFEGEKSPTARNRELGWFELAEIPPGGPGEPQIEVTFHVDATGAFSIMARDAHWPGSARAAALTAAATSIPAWVRSSGPQRAAHHPDARS